MILKNYFSGFSGNFIRISWFFSTFFSNNKIMRFKAASSKTPSYERKKIIKL